MADNFDQSQWITTGEAAELTGYSASYFRKAIFRGLLSARKRGRDWFLNRDEVTQYADEMQQLGAGKHDPRRVTMKTRS